MRWLVVFLIILVMVMACESVSDTADGADSSLVELEARVNALEREVWGFSTYPLEVFNSRIDRLEERLRQPSYQPPSSYPPGYPVK